jgi:4-methyl-5(b-hydroxyethyl)-thiazole monophosphate biosynthesis
VLQERRNGAAHNGVLILLAKGFQEGTTVYCLERLRQAGISVSLVGMSARNIKGYHGVTLRPDLSMEQLPDVSSYRLIILPAGKACVSALFADPRVHQLIEMTLHNRGLVAAMPDAEVMLELSGFVTSRTAPSFIWRSNGELEDFATQLIDNLAEIGNGRSFLEKQEEEPSQF